MTEAWVREWKRCRPLGESGGTAGNGGACGRGAGSREDAGNIGESDGGTDIFFGYGAVLEKLLLNSISYA
jgi:hypothetical protein